MTVVRFVWAMSSYTKALPVVSRWLVGSSIRTMEGLKISCPARKTLVFSPPLRLPMSISGAICPICHLAKASVNLSGMSHSSFSCSYSFSVPRPSNMIDKALNLSANPNASATLIPSNCPKCCGIMYKMSSHTMVPVAGGIFPANILRSVDFPTPLFPTIAHFSPAGMVKVIF